MEKYKQIYVTYFEYGIQDYIPCELCGKQAADIHHIYGRGKGKDVIENLMAVCRDCHTDAHNEKISKSEMQYIHNNWLAGNRKKFIK